MVTPYISTSMPMMDGGAFLEFDFPENFTPNEQQHFRSFCFQKLKILLGDVCYSGGWGGVGLGVTGRLFIFLSSFLSLFLHIWQAFFAC